MIISEKSMISLKLKYKFSMTYIEILGPNSNSFVKTANLE